MHMHVYLVKISLDYCGREMFLMNFFISSSFPFLFVYKTKNKPSSWKRNTVALSISTAAGCIHLILVVILVLSAFMLKLYSTLQMSLFCSWISSATDYIQVTSKHCLLPNVWIARYFSAKFIRIVWRMWKQFCLRIALPRIPLKMLFKVIHCFKNDANKLLLLSK